MRRNRVFFPQTALDEWVAEDTVDVSDTELVIRAEGRRYSIEEAVRVLREVTDTGDPHEFVGKVKPVAALAELGAELLDTSMLIGDHAYDVIPGFVGEPIGSFQAHMTGSDRVEALARSRRDVAVQSKPHSDEDLLAQYLMRTLD